MATITFDTLKFVRRLKESGIPEGQAEAFADAFKDAQGEAEFATKRDLKDTEAALRQEIESVRRDLRELEQRMVIKLGGLMVVAVGSVAALVKLL